LGEKVSITDEIIGISQLLGGTFPGCPAKSIPMHVHIHCKINDVKMMAKEGSLLLW